MVAKIIDGKAIAAKLRAKIALTINRNSGPPPKLAVILVGNDPASKLYVSNKHIACQEVGIMTEDYCLASSSSEQKVYALINQLNHAADIHGILLQLPLPPQLNCAKLLEAINPLKDVDGFHSSNLGKLALNQAQLFPCTPRGVMLILAHIKQIFTGKHAVIIGASNIVGKPMALELLTAGCTVTICHKFTQDLAKHVARADILISAVGKPGLIKGRWIKPGATVIDVGITMSPTGKMLGDVEFNSAIAHAQWLTPVPGGVGPMTVAVLLQNTVTAQLLQSQASARYPS
jgi:methylenetetrahydrofolate dehydrogenase (NADP+)/methenyltetrahydrofolate cyclohydrolase